MIEVASLTKRYGSTVAVQDLSFTVRAGRVTGFLGPNGAGKSTTMRVILGLVQNEDLRVAQQRGSETEALPHPQRIALDPAPTGL